MWTCDSPLKIGDDQSSCAESFRALCVLATEGGCEDGKSFNGAKADECTEAIKAQSCQAYNNSEELAACSQTCQ
jgi:hypothetical protein